MPKPRLGIDADQFELLSRQAVKHHRLAHVVVNLFLIVCVVTGIVLVTSSLLLFGETRIGDSIFIDGPGWLGVPVLVGAIVCFALPPMLIGALVRNSWIDSVTHRFILELRCICGYSLSGLNATDGIVVCPECADRIVLADRGLTPEMLLAGELGESGGSG